jgi:hypothetical protein
MSDKYLVISADCHAGLPAEQYREYVDPNFRDTYDEWISAAQAFSAARMMPSEDREKWVTEWREEIEEHGGMRGSWDANIRDKELDGDGVACEVIFPDADAAGVGGVSARHSAPARVLATATVLVMEGKAHNQAGRTVRRQRASGRRRAVPILHNQEAALRRSGGEPRARGHDPGRR